MRERNADLQGWSYSLLLLSCLTAAAAIMTFLVFRFLRKPFQTYVLQNNTSWLLLCFPVLMVFLLFSYVRNSTTDGVLLALLLLTAFSIFLILIRVLTSAAFITRLRASERAVSLQMRIQRREYEDIEKTEFDGLDSHEISLTRAMFADSDELVHCGPEFELHYPGRGVSYPGKHLPTYPELKNYLVPLVRDFDR